MEVERQRSRRLDQDFHRVKGHLHVAMVIAFFEDVLVELELIAQIIIGVFGVVMGDDPFGCLGIFAKEGCIGDRRMSPTNPSLVLEGSELCLMDQNIA